MKHAVPFGCSTLLLAALAAERGAFWIASAFAFIAFCALIYIVVPSEK